MVAAIGHDDMANAIRALAMDAVEKAKSGHPGMPMGMADVATVLFREQLRFDAADPDWPDRDRFVLSAGHGSMLLYALLYLTGYPGVDIEELKNFRQLSVEDGRAPRIRLRAGHRDDDGAARAGPRQRGRHGARRTPPRSAARPRPRRPPHVGRRRRRLPHGGDQPRGDFLAGHLKLGKLIVLFDDNAISIDGPTDLAVSDDQIARFQACGWNTARVDGHDPKAISAALARARGTIPPLAHRLPDRHRLRRPEQGRQGLHARRAARRRRDRRRAREARWPHQAFAVLEPVLAAWREAVGARQAGESAAWRARLAQADPSARAWFETPAGTSRRPEVANAVAAAKAAFAGDTTKRATRVWSQLTLERIVPVLPELIGGSADLTGSNGTRTKHHTVVAAGNFAGPISTTACASTAWPRR